MPGQLFTPNELSEGTTTMFGVPTTRRHRQGGQALVILTVAVIPALLMVGLIVDGGNAWTQQRLTQNAADAAADAGATVLAKRDIGQKNCNDACWDAKVVAAVTQAGTDKGVSIKLCAQDGAECTYMDCTSFGVSTARCASATWQLSTTPCAAFQCGSPGGTPLMCQTGQLCVVSRGTRRELRPRAAGGRGRRGRR